MTLTLGSVLQYLECMYPLKLYSCSLIMFFKLNYHLKNTLFYITNLRFHYERFPARDHKV